VGQADAGTAADSSELKATHGVPVAQRVIPRCQRQSLTAILPDRLHHTHSCTMGPWAPPTGPLAMAVTRLIHAAQSRWRGRTYEDTTTAMASDSQEGSPGHPRWGGMRWWLALGAVVLVLGCIFVLPRLIYPPLSSETLNQLGLRGKERLDARNDRLRLQNDARATLLQGVGGIAVLLTVYFTWRQLQHNLEATRRQQQATQDQIELSRQQQLTERFTRAIDQLGSESEDVRLGAIYALEQISRISATERAAIYEILSAYVRGHSPWPPLSQPPEADGMLDMPRLHARLPAVQAAMIVLARRASPEKRDSTEEPLSLMGADLRRMRLYGPHVRGGANLKGALLSGSHLGRAGLRYAHLQGAHLREANLAKALLRNADLSGADLSRADLSGADLRGANLSGATNIRSANLTQAKADSTTIWPDGFDWRKASVVMQEPDPTNQALRAEPFS
jgi:Pentapeptide repeats (8 copies)